MAARGSRAYFFDLFRMRGAARQTAATSKTGFLVNCSTAAVHLQNKQSRRLRLDPYVSHREGSIVVLPAANLRGPPDKYGLLTLGRPSVRCTSRSGSGVLCSAARFFIPTYHTGSAALSFCRPPISEGHPISMVWSRSGVRLYDALHAPGLASCVRQHASCQPRRQRWLLAVAGLIFFICLECEVQRGNPQPRRWTSGELQLCCCTATKKAESEPAT